MNETAKRRGRHAEYSEDRKPITIWLPIELIKYIDSTTTNRTKWLLEAAQEKREKLDQNSH